MPRTKSLTRTIVEPIAIAIVLAVAVRAAVKIYSIPSPSMTPTLQVGDHIVVTPYVAGGPQRGHVVVFRSTQQSGELLVKRIIATPGDLVDSRLGYVRVGGRTLAEPYVLRPAASGAIQAQIVPSGSYFVMGDNREVSSDSRSWGVVPREQIVGRARMILWSSSVAAEQTAGAATRSASIVRVRAQRPQRLFKWVE